MDDQARKINFVHVTSSRDFLPKDTQERRWFVVDNEINHGGTVGQLPDVMIDIETMGTTPGAAILSIGAVTFGRAGLGEIFYAPVLLQSCLDAGLHIDPETDAWWAKQSDAARAAAFRNDAAPLATVLEQFSNWFNLVRAERPWSQGANFDPPLLDAAYRACGMTPPWKYWNVRDTRTLYDLAGVKVDRSKGTHHNALDDARTQAEAAVKALNILNPDGGRFAWAVLAESGNVIIWSRRRDQVEPLAEKYRRPVVPVIVLSPGSIPQPAGVPQGEESVTAIGTPTDIVQLLPAAPDGGKDDSSAAGGTA